MRWLALALALALASGTEARELWSVDGFKLESAGWMDNAIFPEWTGLRCGLTVPAEGWFVIEEAGAVEVYVPGLGWVRDLGILVVDGCRPTPDNGRDTRRAACCVTEDYACPSQGDRVLMMILLPKMFPTPDNRPTQARWVTTKASWHAQNR